MFPNYRKEMKRFEWGDLYNEYSGINPDDHVGAEHLNGCERNTDIST